VTRGTCSITLKLPNFVTILSSFKVILFLFFFFFFFFVFFFKEKPLSFFTKSDALVYLNHKFNSSFLKFTHGRPIDKPKILKFCFLP
jgi:hypothetical protein